MLVPSAAVLDGVRRAGVDEIVIGGDVLPGPLRAAAEAMGSGDLSPLWSGQNASGCKAIPAAELTRELASDL